MALYERREVTTVTIEYTLPNPSPAAEMGKAYAAAEAEIKAAGLHVYDDSVMVHGRDDEIVLVVQKTWRQATP